MHGRRRMALDHMTAAHHDAIDVTHAWHQTAHN